MTIVLRYRGGRGREVADLILSIQNGEAGLALTLADQPDLLDIDHHYRAGGFWIAVDGVEVAIVGTIGLLTFGSIAVPKKFFVSASRRGSGCAATKLFDSLMMRATDLTLTDIVLDTPSVATRSHDFDARNGFERARAENLPTEYRFPDRNSLLLRCRLIRSDPDTERS
jgi:N-acetylglutamate synthase-like GNAT family acetyltransferase